MSKLILLSILIALIAIPTIASRNPDPRLGLRRATFQVLIFEAVYAFSLIYLWGRW